MTDQEHQALDSRVALAIFGEEWPGDLKFSKESDEWHCVGYREHNSARRMNNYLPRYSTSIKAAWQIVEHIRAKGEQFTLGSAVHRGGWNADFWQPGTGSVGGYGETPALAISHAALAWAERTKR